MSQAGERRIRSAQLVSKAPASSATPPPTVPARSGGTAGPANSTVPSHHLSTQVTDALADKRDATRHCHSGGQQYNSPLA